MISALRIIMVTYAVIGILFGLAYIFIPFQLAAMLGFEEGPEHVAALTVALGISFVAACIFLIIAARDPIKYILWVKYAIAFALLMLAGELYSFFIGYVNFSQAVMGIIIHAVFGVALLAFYPWRAVKGS